MVNFIKKGYRKYNEFLSRFVDKHPLISMIILLYMTYGVISSNQYFQSVIYIALSFSMIMIYGLSKIKTTKNTRVLLIVSFITVVFLAFIYIFSGLFVMIPEELRMLKLNEWVSILSIIFAGFLTMYGVWYSIEETRKINNKTLVIQSIPIMKVTIDDQPYASSSYSKDANGKTIESKDIGIFLRLNIENTTIYGAKDFEFELFNIAIYDVFEYGLYRGEHKDNIKSINEHDFAQNINKKINNDIVLFQNNSFSIDLFFPYPLKNPDSFIAVFNATLVYKYLVVKEPYKTRIEIDFTPKITLLEKRKTEYKTFNIVIEPNITQYFVKNDDFFEMSADVSLVHKKTT